MRQPYSEFELGIVRFVLWAAAIVAVMLVVVFTTWGCGPSDPSTGRLELEEEVVFEDNTLELEESEDE